MANIKATIKENGYGAFPAVRKKTVLANAAIFDTGDLEMDKGASALRVFVKSSVAAKLSFNCKKAADNDPGTLNDDANLNAGAWSTFTLAARSNDSDGGDLLYNFSVDQNAVVTLFVDEILAGEL